ncbi:MAG: hypothetical protein EOM52_08850 [Clostridia bacterium]|nr:hypothetical protein [Clostridia bacterium]
MDGLTSWFRTLLEISLAMSPVMALLLLCRPFFKTRYRAKWAYWAWLLVAVRLLIPLNFSLPVTPVTIPEPGVSVNLPVAFERTKPAASANTAPVQDGGTLPDPETDPLPIKASLVMDGWTVVACVWLLGFILALILTVMPYLRFRRQVRRWSMGASEPEFDALRAELNAGRLGLKRCPVITVPMVTGFFRLVLLIPVDGPLPPDPILRHEIVHYKRRDLWYKLAVLLAECVHWFNPLVWLMGAAASRDLERSCDETVTAGQGDEYRERYSRAILDAVDAAQPARTPLTSYFHGGKNAMLERLASILNTEGKKRGTAVLALLLAAVVLGAACFTVGRPVIVEDNEFKITLPSGMTWVGPEQKPGLTAQFYQNGVEAGGLAGISGSLDELETLWQGESMEYAMFGSSPLGGKAIPGWEGELKRNGASYEEVHYYFYAAENQIYDLWFRLDMITRREAQTAAESFIKSLGAGHSKSPDGRYDLSFILAESGGCRWFLREKGEIVGAANTSYAVLWQKALWSPDGKWASAWDADDRRRNFVLFSVEDGALTTRHPDWNADTCTPIEWGTDNRLQFFYVRKSGDSLESGTAWYDPVTGDVVDVEESATAVPVYFAPSGVPGNQPPWSMPVPEDMEVRSDAETPGGAVLVKDGVEVGLVLPTTEKSDGYMGINRYYTNHERLGEGAMAAVCPAGGDRAYELVFRESSFRQDLLEAMVKQFLVDGETAYRDANQPSTESTHLWTRRFDGYSVSLRETAAAQMDLVLEQEGASTVLATLDYDSTHPYFPTVDADAFQNVLGQDGFVLSYQTGLAWQSYDYYGMDTGGTPTLLAECYNAVYELDVDGDGSNELLSNYHTQAYADLYLLRDDVPVKLNICAAADDKLGYARGTCGLRYEEQTKEGLAFQAESRSLDTEIPDGTKVVLTVDEILAANAD